MTILYCGDTTLSSNAAYLAGLMTAWNWPFRYVPSDQRLDALWLEGPLELVVLSDYPAAQLSRELQQRLVDRVRTGTGLVMFGGWESFHGLGGDWDQTLIAEILPVSISTADDRRNFDQPCLVHPTEATHPILTGLPWCTRPPGIGGLNAVTPKPESKLLLEACQLSCSAAANSEFQFETQARWPLLVVGQFGAGRTAAFTSDISPHWVGGLVDWGPDRVTAQAAGAGGIEVGNHYARFFQQLLGWTRAEGIAPRE